VGSGAGCDAIDAVYCNDFEDGTLGMAPSGDFSVGSSIIVDGTNAFSGSQAVRITTAQPGSSTVMEFTNQTFPNDFYGRVMVNMTATPNNSSHWDLLILRGGGYDWELGGQYGNFELVVDPPDDGIDSDTEFPTGEWFCLQWQFNYASGGDNTYLAKVNGTDVDPGLVSGRWQAGAWESLRIGFVPYQTSDVDIEIWIDDLAFGETPIPCPN
jgi:hypothetical protein